MASFATTFPVDDAQDASSFLEFVRRWLVATKGFSEEDLSGIRGTSWTLGGAEARTNGADLAGFRLREDGSSLTISFRRPWVTIYATDSGATAKRPQILRYLVGDLGEGSDDSFAVGGDPILLGNADINRASRAVSGLFGREMPVVYVSAPAEEPNEKLARELAAKLRDEAHVLVEPNRAFSKRCAIPLGTSRDKVMGDVWCVVVRQQDNSLTTYVLTPEQIKKGAHKDGKGSWWVEPKKYELLECRENWKFILKAAACAAKT